MSFVRKNSNLQPIKDAVFYAVNLAKKDIDENGKENVVNATIGSLFDENENLIAMKSVFDHYDLLDPKVKAKYAQSYDGNPDYKKAIYDWATLNTKLNLEYRTVATPGASGALSSVITTVLEPNETLIIQDICWSNYKLMAEENHVNYKTFEMFEDDHFNLNSLKETILSVKKHQDRILILINDPCHNPTGYSMSSDEWFKVVDMLNQLSSDCKIVLINDTAYIDYSDDIYSSRNYLNAFNNLCENVLVVIAMSCSKSFTSYGLRCGGAIILGKTKEVIKDMSIILEKKARATWSNIANAAMENIAWVINNNRENYIKELSANSNMLKKRIKLFIDEANSCNLKYFKHMAGFFVTIKVDDPEINEKYHQELIKNHIYAVKINKGIRVALSGLPLNKVKGLAYKMKQILDSIK